MDFPRETSKGVFRPEEFAVVKHVFDAVTGEAPDCSVTWTAEGRVYQRHCGPLDRSSIEDWL